MGIFPSSLLSPGLHSPGFREEFEGEAYEAGEASEAEAEAGQGGELITAGLWLEDVTGEHSALLAGLQLPACPAVTLGHLQALQLDTDCSSVVVLTLLTEVAGSGHTGTCSQQW